MIRVGGGTEVEVKERKDRVDDAMHATKAAVEEGVVAGGGVALLFASKVLAGLNPANNDQKLGIEIVRKAVQSSVRQIAENSGTDGSIVVGKLTDKGDPNFGYPAVRVCMWTGPIVLHTAEPSTAIIMVAFFRGSEVMIGVLVGAALHWTAEVTVRRTLHRAGDTGLE